MATDDKDRRADLSALRIPDEARGGRRRGRLVPVLAVGLAVGATLAATLAARGRSAEVEVATARGVTGEGQAATLLNASGYVTPRRRATVAAKITARVVEMLADEGMVVEAGELLARLDDSDATRRLAAARAERDVAAAAVKDLEVNLANAERELVRQRELQRDGVSSEQSLDAAGTLAASLGARLAVAREQVRAAGAGMAVAQQDVDNCTVRAPFAGVVVSKDAQVGEMVSPISAGGGFTRTGIATVVDMTSLEIEVDVNESYIAKVSPGQRVEATLDAYPAWKMPASVRTVIPTADRQKATVKVRISFAALDPRILPDMGVKVAVLAEPDAAAGERAPRVLVPRSAVRNEAGSPVVFLVREGRLERRAVKVGADRGADVEVLAGLSDGEQVVAVGPADLEDGQRVRVK
ncbi:MAG: efflux RND transporter periplasmic adaptor subunit [Acidobacteria bacterium]|nr:efflux RND transporter periplasmic adaptor subunit [Acidobacteriota bacterium]